MLYVTYPQMIQERNVSVCVHACVHMCGKRARERERERERGIGAEGDGEADSPLSRESHVGLHPRTLRS